jgi:hypothetical protein
MIGFLVVQSHSIWQRMPSGVKEGGSSSPLLDAKFSRRSRICFNIALGQRDPPTNLDLDAKFAVRRTRLLHRGGG